MDRSNFANLSHRFEHFVTKIFEQQGFEPIRDAAMQDRGYDIRVIGDRASAVVEIKLYTSMTPATRSILMALQILESERTRTGASHGILAVNGRITEQQRAQLERFPALRIYDYDVLAALVSSDLALSQELEEITRSALVFRGEDLPTAERVDVPSLIEDLGGGDAAAPRSTEPDTPDAGEDKAAAPPPARGKELCEEIHDVEDSKGKPFEVACEAAIRYLFEDELVAFDNQHQSHTGLHQFDLVARIASREDFWQALITDFRARYVVFEFKNYKKPITQREVYTTEKYLYPIAMRGAAIIVSRHGADNGADQAMRGALREHGKLILSLSLKELCEMLHARDAGSDHLITLVNKLDAMLMGLER